MNKELKENIHIVVIDSGIDRNANFIDIKKIKNYISFNEKNKVQFGKKYCEDKNGHGTSVTYILSKYLKNSYITFIKIFNKSIEADEDILLKSLNYINSNIKCNIINLSCGLINPTNYKNLKIVCDKLEKKGIIIVSAFSNDGEITYPAAFDSVIGVDSSLSCFNPTMYQYIENSIINIRGMAYSQRILSLNDNYISKIGSSYIVPHISGRIVDILLKGIKDKKHVMEELKNNANKIYSSNLITQNKEITIKKACIFPVSKELYPLVRFSDMLNFEISHIVDFKYGRNIGKSISEIYDIEDNLIIIENYEKLNWQDEFDTVIIGHLNMLVKAMNADLKEEILNMCLKNKKQVYMFDTEGILYEKIEMYRNKGLKIFIPEITSKHCPKNNFGKLHISSSLIVGVFGTSPKQGKYTLQLLLRNYFKNKGYNVCNFGTEPTAKLFGFEAMYPIGHNSTVRISGFSAISYINNQIKKIDYEEPDIIFVGSQSQSVPSGVGNLMYYPVMQHELVLGTMPDAYILCINISDPIEYIDRTIKYFRSINNSEIICFVAFPYEFDRNLGYTSNKKKIVSRKLMNEFISKIENEFNIRAFSLNDKLLLFNVEKIIKENFS